MHGSILHPALRGKVNKLHLNCFADGPGCRCDGLLWAPGAISQADQTISIQIGVWNLSRVLMIGAYLLILTTA